MLDRDLEPDDHNDEWVHIDNVADSQTIREKLDLLTRMVESDSSKADVLMAIEEIYQYLGDV